MLKEPPITIDYASTSGEGWARRLAWASLLLAAISFPTGAGFSMVTVSTLGIRNWTEWTGFLLFAGGITCAVGAAIAALALALRRGRWIAVVGLTLSLIEMLIVVMLAHQKFHLL